MKGVLSIFILPQEVESFINLFTLLKRNSVFLTQENLEMHADITLCLSLTNWQESSIPRQYFVDRVQETLAKLGDWLKVDLKIEEGEEILGCVSQRRYSWKKHEDADFFIWADSDMMFGDTLLFYLIEAYKVCRDEECFVVSPQNIKLGDRSWDVLCHERFLDKPWNYNHIADTFRDVLTPYGEASLQEIVSPKFGGGWLNLLSKKLLDQTGIPEEFGHYGLEDTFVMYCMRNRGYKQYMIKNMLACELYKQRTDSGIAEYISIVDKKDEFRDKAHKGWSAAVENFLKKQELGRI